MGVVVRWAGGGDVEDGAEYQYALQRMTGRTTVPNIFLHQKNIGGCDDIHALHSQGKLVALL